MGAQDNLEFAQAFLEQTGVSTPIMIWDESFVTWSYYGVSSQPTAVLVDQTGQPIQGWVGSFDFEDVLGLI